MEEKRKISKQKRKDYVVSITMIGILFFIFGFITWLNGTLIPFLKISCELNNVQAYLVTFAFYISYFVMAIPSSWVLHRTGFKGGMALGLLVMAIGTLVFLPAASTRTYAYFLVGLFIQGTGLAILQTASNPYITIIGPIESAAKRISIMGICNKIAGVLSPLILGAIVLKDADAIKEGIANATDLMQKNELLDEMASRVMVPYVIMAIVLSLLALLIKVSKLPEIDTDEHVEHFEQNDNNKEKVKSIFSFPYILGGVGVIFLFVIAEIIFGYNPHLWLCAAAIAIYVGAEVIAGKFSWFWLGVLSIFFYVGAEVIAGDTIILYGTSLNIPMDQARAFTSYTLIAMVLGYILSIALIPRVISQSKALLVSAVLGILFTLGAVLTSGYYSVMCIALLGFANAVMWPAIWPLAINGLGRFTKIGSAILIMGIAGGAILPLVYGRLADQISIGNQHAYLMLVFCYLFIIYFAFAGHKRKNPVYQNK